MNTILKLGKTGATFEQRRLIKLVPKPHKQAHNGNILIPYHVLFIENYFVEKNGKTFSI